MHGRVKPHQKSGILSLVAGLFSAAELKNHHFQFSSTQYQNALCRVAAEDFHVDTYQRIQPPSKTPINSEIRGLISSYLVKNSQSSSLTINSGEVYYLGVPKREVYHRMIKDHPQLQEKLSLSKFYKLCPKNFKKATKKTDVCQVCEAGKKVKKLLQQARKVRNLI